MASSDFSPGFPLDFTSQLIPSVTVGVDDRPSETSPVPSPPVLTHLPPCGVPFPLRRRVLHGCSFRFFTASLAFAFVDKLGFLFFPYGLTFRRCKIHLMLRAVSLLPFLKELQRFSTSSRPEALVACYVAA